jgi:hypothetical protein
VVVSIQPRHTVLDELSTTAINGDEIRIRLQAANAFESKKSSLLTIGNVVKTFTVTTYAQDSDLNDFDFQLIDNASLLTEYTSNTINIVGLLATETASIDEGILVFNGVEQSSKSIQVNNSDSLNIKLTSSALLNTTVTSNMVVGIRRQLAWPGRDN